MSFFDNEAMLYDEWYKTKMGNFVDEVETKCVFDLLKIKPGTKVLDVGCGTGNFSMKLARMGCKVTAIDISEEMLKVGKTKAKKENLDIQFYNMNVYDLQFEANYFDAVISVTAFEFIKDTRRAIEEMFRVLNDNGQIVIGTINKDSQWGNMYLSKEFQENTVFKYAVFKTEEDLKQLKPDKLKDIRKCLFISPSAKEEEISLSKEKELFKHNKRGGFVCALWEK